MHGISHCRNDGRQTLAESAYTELTQPTDRTRIAKSFVVIRSFPKVLIMIVVAPQSPSANTIVSG